MINNPIQMNDWEIKKFLMAILIIQLVLLGLWGLNAIGLGIPPLIQIAGFVYLSFVPGIIILRLLRFHAMGAARTLLYVIGLSLTFNMFLGLIVNMLYPLIWIQRPISTLPLIITWTVVLGLLCLIAYKRDKDFSAPTHLEKRDLFSPQVLFFILLPLLAVVGAQFVNIYENNIILLTLLAVITLTALVIMITNFLPVRFYPLAIFSIALALIWHVSLISEHLTGTDIFTEFQFYSLVIKSGFWDPSIHNDYNAMLSITLLPAIYSNILNMGGEQLFKIIYPIWYALVPLALYLIYGKLINAKRAFSATFFFMSVYVFYLILYSLARQMVGELFYVLLILLIVDKTATGRMNVLFILFGASLVVSHYALSYIYMGLLIFSIIMLYILREKKLQITASSSILFIIMCLSWYIYVSASAPLDKAVGIGQQIWQSLSTEFLNLFNRDVISMFTVTSPDILHVVYRIIYYLLLFFVAMGAWKILILWKEKESPKEYLTLAVGNYVLLAVCIIVPFFSQQIGANRMYHLSLVILAPFCVLGAEVVFAILSRLTRSIMHFEFSPNSNMVIGPILALLLLFDSGFIFEVANNPRLTSIPLSLNATENPSRSIALEDKLGLRYFCPTEEEISSARWLSENMNNSKYIYTIYFENVQVPALAAYGLIPKEKTIPILPPPSDQNFKDGYVYLGYVNVVWGYGATPVYYIEHSAHDKYRVIWDISLLKPMLENIVQVYTNGGSQVYWSP
ncbi:MAG: DUF2206 domain-containing protein [Dehalococcoidia bacterium]|jgi:uncharacterized membrane protein